MKSKTNWSLVILGGLALAGCAVALKEEEKKPMQPALLPTEDDIIKRKFFSLSSPSDKLNKPFIVNNGTNTYFPLIGKMGRTGLVTGVHLHIALQKFNPKYGWYNVDPTKRLGLS